jgi:hypothetical protein
MTASDRLIQSLAGCSFSIGSASKRFVRDISSQPADFALTERQEAFAWRIAFHYRRQLPIDLSAEAVRRSAPHQVVPAKDKWYEADCAVCLQHLTKRELKSPCSGPPKPKPARKSRSKGAVQQCEPITDSNASLFAAGQKDGEA